jgi:hypothetical protein
LPRRERARRIISRAHVLPSWKDRDFRTIRRSDVVGLVKLRRSIGAEPVPFGKIPRDPHGRHRRQQIIREIYRLEAMLVERLGQVNTDLDRRLPVVNPALRKQTLALELARLDEMELRFYEHALEGDVPSGALVAKLIERRGVMLGLHTPQTAVLQIVDEAKPKQTSTDRIEAALNALLTDGGRKKPAEEVVEPKPADADASDDA